MSKKPLFEHESTQSDCLLISEEFCGNFAIPCQTNCETLWSIQDELLEMTKVTATISVYYDQGCSQNLEVFVCSSTSQTAHFFVRSGNTRSVTVLCPTDLQISCAGTASGTCDGRYCINLHYLL